MNNEEIDKIPEPENSGVEATQIVASPIEIQPLIRGAPSGGISHYPLTDAIREISESGVRGQAGMILLQAFTKRLESDLSETKQEKNEGLAEVKKWKEDYYDEKEKGAVLRERLRISDRVKILQNIFITLGGMVVGVAVPNLRSEQNAWAIAGIILGACLLLIGWFFPFRSREEVSR